MRSLFLFALLAIITLSCIGSEAVGGCYVDLNTIYTGDARELIAQIPDASIDLIFTDPPYLKEFLPLYHWLAKEAERVLKPTGFLLCYVGNVWKAEIYRYLLNTNLDYFWDFIAMHSGMGTMVWSKRVIARHKSILAFRKSDLAMPRTNVLGVWTGTGGDKRFHRWGQDESTARYFIDCFTRPGDIVLDPFIGGGTTGSVCKVLDRRWIGYEIDPQQAAIARLRIDTTQMPLFPESMMQAEMFNA